MWGNDNESIRAVFWWLHICFVCSPNPFFDLRDRAVHFLQLISFKTKGERVSSKLTCGIGADIFWNISDLTIRWSILKNPASCFWMMLDVWNFVIYCKTLSGFGSDNRQHYKLDDDFSSEKGQVFLCGLGFHTDGLRVHGVSPTWCSKENYLEPKCKPALTWQYQIYASFYELALVSCDTMNVSFSHCSTSTCRWVPLV